MFSTLLRFFAATGDKCIPSDPKWGQNEFFGLPHWYQYLRGEEDAFGKCIPTISWNINDVWPIALAIVDILLRIAGMVAVGFVIYGGIQYVLSQGEPDKTKNARTTILNALIGLVITIIAVPIVSYIGNSIK